LTRHTSIASTTYLYLYLYHSRRDIDTGVRYPPELRVPERDDAVPGATLPMSGHRGGGFCQRRLLRPARRLLGVPAPRFHVYRILRALSAHLHHRLDAHLYSQGDTVIQGHC
jgi:hypothetical protein